MASNYNTNSNESLKNCDQHETMSSPPLLFDETDMLDIDNRRMQRKVTRAKPRKQQQQIGQDTRREDTPLSFTHFLNSNSQNYHQMGARPKVYPMTNVEQDLGIYSRNPTELPDFVQDHLVIEQCYLTNEQPDQRLISDVDNLPDFALNSVGQRQTKLQRNGSKMTGQDNLPFDLTGRLEIVATSTPCGPLDLPSYSRSVDDSKDRTESIQHPGFPFDLQLPTSEANIESISNDNTTSTKFLPDFLNDGPVRSRTTPSPEFSHVTSIVDSKHKLLLENETLRYELEITRKQASERLKRMQELESELASRKEVEYEETAHLEKAMEQVEDNLKRSRRRAVSAESTVTSLKKEIRELRTEMSLLESENTELKNKVAGNSRTEMNSCQSNADRMIRRLAGDLRTAASTAEVSLRQLMSGVNNLRVLASTLENVDRIEDRTKDFLPDSDEDNATGPAL